jgi:hypothetical protein
MDKTSPTHFDPAGGRFTYRQLSLDWDAELMAWVCPVPQLGAEASLRLLATQGDRPPSVLVCEVALATLVLIERMDHDARRYLASEAEGYICETYQTGPRPADFSALCLELNGEGNSDRFSLTYRAAFDPYSVWKVRFRGLVPLHWRVDHEAGDLPVAVRGRSAGAASATDGEGSLVARIGRRWMGPFAWVARPAVARILLHPGR